MLKTVSKTTSYETTYVCGGTCDNCGNDLEWSNGYAPFKYGKSNREGFMNTLTLTLKGGYGAYFDDANKHIMLCCKCADALLEALVRHSAESMIYEHPYVSTLPKEVQDEMNQSMRNLMVDFFKHRRAS